MAFKGLRRQGICVITINQAADGTETELLGEGVVLPQIIRLSTSNSQEEAELYASDTLAENETNAGFGAITMGVGNLDDETEALMLGHSFNAGEVISKSDDVAPYLRCASIVPGTVFNVPKFKVYAFTKVKFQPASLDFESKQKSTTYKTPELTGNFFPNAEGIWERHKTFDSFTEAETYFNAFLNITKGGA